MEDADMGEDEVKAVGLANATATVPEHDSPENLAVRSDRGWVPGLVDEIPW